MAENLPPMEYRFLGKTGLKVSVISLGGWLTYGGLVDDGNDFLLLHGGLAALVATMVTLTQRQKEPMRA